ncbi:MAG: 4-hydroxythreonine-4-phosphate dehydrogenase PdxA, partial [Bacteroidetes bacterium]|nr:4-hydroxythreonine-4-phosphate dehydrogenase PdxA [Bacteroidota bacterium]
MAKDPDDILLGITIGDINGIGSELIIKTLLDERLLNYFTPVIFGSSRVISYHRKVLNLPDFKYNIVRTEAGPKKNMVNIVNCWEEEAKVELGEAS